MKIVSIILGLSGLIMSTACKCDPDEDEPGNKYKEIEKNNVRKNRVSVKADTVIIK